MSYAGAKMIIPQTCALPIATMLSLERQASDFALLARSLIGKFLADAFCRSVRFAVGTSLPKNESQILSANSHHIDAGTAPVPDVCRVCFLCLAVVDRRERILQNQTCSVVATASPLTLATTSAHGRIPDISERPRQADFDNSDEVCCAAPLVDRVP